MRVFRNPQRREDRDNLDSLEGEINELDLSDEERMFLLMFGSAIHGIASSDPPTPKVEKNQKATLEKLHGRLKEILFT